MNRFLSGFGWTAVWAGTFAIAGAGQALADGSLINCGPIVNSTGGLVTYTLANDVSTSGDCFTLSGVHDVVIDGNGKKISANGAAFIISGQSTNITIQNAVIDAVGRGVWFPTSSANSCDQAQADGVTVKDIHFLNGGIESGDGDSSGALCHFTLEHSVFDNAGIGILNYGWTPPGLEGVRITEGNVFHGGVSVYNMNDVVIDDHNELYSFLDMSNVTGFQIQDNTIVSGTWPDWVQTQSIFVMRGVNGGTVENNYIKSVVTVKQAAIVKLYVFQNSTLQNNFIIRDPASAPDDPDDLAYGVIEMRSEERDDLFLNNTLIAARHGNALFSAFSNVCCNVAGDFASPCQNPGLNPDGYNEPCHNRNNTFDGNTLIAPSGALNLADGTYGNTIRNNVIVGPAFSSSPASDPNYWFNNTFDGEGGTALAVLSGTTAFAYNNIFRTDGTYKSVDNKGSFTGDYNLFWPVDFTGQAHSIHKDPQFADISSSDPAARDYSLSQGSPAIDAGDPATISAWNVTDDRLLGLRPSGSGFDIGAYEYGATPGMAPVPTPLSAGGNSDPPADPAAPTTGTTDSPAGIASVSGGCQAGGFAGLACLMPIILFVLSRRGRTSRHGS